jgi:hypothetical protein
MLTMVLLRWCVPSPQFVFAFLVQSCSCLYNLLVFVISPIMLDARVLAPSSSCFLLVICHVLIVFLVEIVDFINICAGPITLTLVLRSPCCSRFHGLPFVAANIEHCLDVATRFLVWFLFLFRFCLIVVMPVLVTFICSCCLRAQSTSPFPSWPCFSSSFLGRSPSSQPNSPTPKPNKFFF